MDHNDPDEPIPGRLVWPVVEPPACPPCPPRYSIAMLFPTFDPWAAAEAQPEPPPPREDPAAEAGA